MNSILYVPTTVKGEVIGVLSVDNQTPDRPFTKGDEHLLSVLADYAAIAIENARLLEESDSRAQALSGLHRVSQSLLSVHDLDELLGTVAENARRVLGADLVVLYEYIEEKDDVRIPPVFRGDIRVPEILRERGELHRESLVFKMVHQDAPFYAADAREDWAKGGFFAQAQGERSESFINREEIVSSAGIPLLIGGEAVGVLFINYRDFCQFTSNHRERTEIFANQAALAIRNARVFSQKERYVEELSVLNEIGQIVSSAVTLDVDKILDLVYQQTARLMGVTNFYVALYDEEDDTVHFRLAVEEDQCQAIGEGEWASRKGGNGLTEYVIRTKRPLLIPGRVEEWLRVHKVEPIGRPAKSWLGAPMIAEQRVLGVIGTQSPEEENAHDEGHRNVLSTIASQAAIAIDKAKEVHRSKQIAKVLCEVTPDAVGLSGQPVHGDLWTRICEVVCKRVPNADVCLYVCDDIDPSIASTSSI